MTASSAACAPSGAHDRPTLSVRRVVVRHSLLQEFVLRSLFLMFGPEIAQLAARRPVGVRRVDVSASWAG